MDDKILIVDISSWFYPLVFKMPYMSYGDRPTSIIFGLMLKILKTAKEFGTNRFIFCFDSIKNKRKLIYPEYKKKRKEKTQEEKENFAEGFYQQSIFRINILPTLGFKNIFQQTQYESDDIIASLVLNNPGQGFTILSKDEDLYQLLRNNVDIYNTKTEKIYTKKNFIEEYGIQPEQWVDVKRIAGCKSDEVSDITGKGNKVNAAIKFIKGELSEKTETYKKFTSQTAQELAKRNGLLTRLPLDGIKVFQINYSWKLNIDDFLFICDKYSFRSLMVGSNFNIWNTIMSKDL